jgi:hypothetical protein
LKQEEEIRITPFIRFQLLQLEAELTQCNIRHIVTLRLGGVQVKQHHDITEIFMINTPMSSGSEEYLITIKFINVSEIFYFWS